MNHKCIIFFLLIYSFGVFAGHEIGNGGDGCENKINEISNELEAWLVDGKYHGLILPEKLTEESYQKSMLSAIKESIVSCIDEKILIGKSEKTCINFIDENGKARINCNRVRIEHTNSELLYKIVHHEYAGIAGLEINNNEYSDEISNYKLTNQLTEFMEEQMVVKLGIKGTSTLKTRFGSCEILMPGLADMRDYSCKDKTKFSINYLLNSDRFEGYNLDGICYDSIVEAVAAMKANEFCKKAFKKDGFDILKPYRRDSSGNICTKNADRDLLSWFGISRTVNSKFGILYNGHLALPQCFDSIADAMKKIEELRSSL